MYEEDKASHIFWSTFIGEYVEMVCENKDVGGYPMLIQGYMLDADEDYYYLGVNSIEVTTAIKKSKIDLIAVIEKIDPNTLLLENMPIPEGFDGN